MSKEWTKAQWHISDARFNYLVEWRNARLEPDKVWERLECDNGSCLTRGDISWLERDKGFEGWVSEFTHNHYVDRLMVVKFGDYSWWMRNKAEREQYIRMRKSGLRAIWYP